MENKRYDFWAEIKEDGEDGEIVGFGSVFGNVDSYGDVVESGAFKRSLKERGLPVMLWQHDSANPIGVWKTAKEQDGGLMLRGQLNLEVQKGKEAYALLKQGALKGLSIGFRTIKSKQDNNGLRRLQDIDLLEVSLVTFPANEKANVVSVKEAKDFPDNERDFETLLREVGCPRELAKAIVAKGFRAATRGQRDAEADTVIEGLQKALKILAGEK